MKTILTHKAVINLAISTAFGIFHCFLGFSQHSWWFMTLGAYYLVLSLARLSVLQVQRRAGGDREIEVFARKITGILLLVLSLCLTGIVTLAAVEERGKVNHQIVMIAIAAFTTYKVTLAVIGLVRGRKKLSPTQQTLAAITMADALTAVYSLQRSMLVTFPGMTAGEIRLFNILTGTGVWLLVLLLGISLVDGRWKHGRKNRKNRRENR